MNNFKEIKKYVSCEDVARKYLGQPEKHNSTGSWYLSPFRSEKTASFCVSDKGFHDFGDSKHYDIISFTQKYFNITPIEALKLLSSDFNYPLEENQYESKRIKQSLIERKKMEVEAKKKVKKWFEDVLKKACDKLLEVKENIRIIEKMTILIGNTGCLDTLYAKENELEEIFEKLTKATEEEMTKLYIENN